MPLCRFLKTVEGDATNRAGFRHGDDAWLSDAEAEAREARGEVDIVGADPGPGVSPKAPAHARMHVDTDSDEA